MADWSGRLFWIALAVAVVVIFSADSNSLRWVIAAVLLLLGLLPIVANWLLVAGHYLGKWNGASMIPLVGGVLAAIAIARLPSDSWNRWWWVALVLDPSAWTTLLAVPFLVRELWNHRRSP